MARLDFHGHQLVALWHHALPPRVSDFFGQGGILPMGGLGPDDIHIPGPFVDRVVALPATLPEVYGVVQR